MNMDNLEVDPRFGNSIEVNKFMIAGAIVNLVRDLYINGGAEGKHILEALHIVADDLRVLGFDQLSM